MKDTNANILEINNLTKTINKKVILDNITFNVEKNSIFGIVGVNGAGKSTLLKIIVGLYKQTSGEVKINGYDTTKDFENAMESVGSVIETPAMYSYLTGEENLEIYKMMFKGVDASRIKEIIKLVSLEGSAYKKLKTYSLGMRQRLGLAQALINNPKLLILDEPTNGLDPIGIKDLRKFLKSLKNTTIIISSHVLSEIELLCNKVLFLDKGKVIDIKQINSDNSNIIKFEVDNYDTASALLTNYNVNNNLEINASNDEISTINKILVNNGIKVYRICESKENLEKEFLTAVGEEND